MTGIGVSIRKKVLAEPKKSTHAQVFVCLGLMWPLSGFSQVITDGTVGSQVQLNGQNVVVGQSLGSLSGANLFHSFSSFNIQADGSVTFTGDGNILNVISRVTGPGTTTIGGLLRSSIPDADFYFFNPAGIVLTGGATIDVPAALHLSTAVELSFSDGTSYHSDSTQTSTLTMSVPESFGFLPQSGDIAISSATQSSVTAGSVALSGANIDVENSAVSLNVNEVTMLAVGDSALRVPVTNSHALTGVSGNVTLTGSSAQHAIVSTGDIYVRGGKIVIESTTLGGVAAGRQNHQISVIGSELEIVNGGRISGDPMSDNGAINIEVAADDLLIDGQDSLGQTGIYNSAASEVDGGDINVRVNGQLQIVDGGEINADSLAEGNAGDITVTAGEVTLDRVDDDIFTGIASGARAAGQGGNLSVIVDGQLRIARGAEITGSANSTGNAGSVTVSAGEIVLDGSDTRYSTGISAQVNGSATGNGGNLIVNSRGAVNIRDGARISAASFGDGDGGTIDLTSDSLTIAGAGTNTVFLTGVTGQTHGTGAGGNLSIETTGQLSLINGGQITSGSFGAGDAGGVTVAASQVVLDRMDNVVFTGISSGAQSTGDGGDVSVTASDSLSIAGGAEITGSTSAAGSSGTVTVNAGDIILDGSDTRFSTGISSQVNSSGTGNGGNVAVTASGSVNISEGARITAATFGDGNGGTISLTSGSLTIETASLDENFITGITGQTHGIGAGGIVSVVTNGELRLIDGGLISSGSFGAGAAGDVTVFATDIFLDRKNNLAFTGISSGVNATGDGGNISVSASGGLSIAGGAEITGSTGAAGNSGTVTVSAGNIMLDGSDTLFSTGISSQVNRSGTGNGGNIAVDASGSVIIREGARITAASFGDGDGGTIDLRSDSLTIEDASTNPDFLTGVTGQTHGIGAGGNVTVVTDGVLSLINGGQISSGSFGSGAAGDVTVSASEIALDRKNNDKFTGISSGVESAGDGGNVSVAATGDLSIAGGAEITGSTSSTGNSGSVNVSASDIRLTGGETLFSTGISSQVNNTGTGNAGNVVVNASGSVNIREGARITAAAFGDGDAGTIALTSDTLTIEEASLNQDFLTGVSGQTHGIGSGANVSVTTHGQLTLFNGGQISSDSFGDGNAGDVFVTAGDIVLDRGTTTVFAGISSGAFSAGSGGNVEVSDTRSVSILNGAEITASTFSSGNAGDVTVNADSMVINRMGSQSPTGISSQGNANSSGDGGSVDINTRRLLITSGGRISVAAFGSGEGGVANIDAGLLRISGEEFEDFTGIQSRTSAASAGALNLNATSVVLENGHILSSTFDSVSDGGDISFTSEVFVMDSGVVQANANSGTGGTININTEALLAAGNSVQVGGVERAALQFDGPNVIQAVAPTGVNGFVAVNAPELDTAALVSGLDSNFYTAESLAQNPCDAFNSGSQSSLVELSLGGLPVRQEPTDTGLSVGAMRQHRPGSIEKPGVIETSAQVLTQTEIDKVQTEANPIQHSEPAEIRMRVKYQWSVVRDAPGLDAKVLASLTVGTEVRLVQKLEGWYQIRVERNNSIVEGFMHHSVLEADTSAGVLSQSANETENLTASTNPRPAKWSNNTRHGCRVG